MTSAIRETSTNIFRIVIEFVDNTLHQGLSLLDSIVGFPVSTDESLVSGEEVSQKESIEHIFFLKLIYNEVWEFEDLNLIQIAYFIDWKDIILRRMIENSTDKKFIEMDERNNPLMTLKTLKFYCEK